MLYTYKATVAEPGQGLQNIEGLIQVESREENDVSNQSRIQDYLVSQFNYVVNLEIEEVPII